MTLMWLIGFAIAGVAFQTAMGARDAMETKGPSTPLRSARDDNAQAGKAVPHTVGPSPAARNDKSNTHGNAPPLAATTPTSKSELVGDPGPLGRGDNSEMAANRVVHRYLQQYKHSADRVFAITEPVEEVKWAPGFEFEWVYAQDGREAKGGQQGDVFVTRHGGHEVVWVISKRDLKERVIQFVRFLPGVETVQIDIHVVPEGRKASKAEITYTWTALSEHGRERLKQHTQEAFDTDMKEWEEQVNDYLRK